MMTFRLELLANCISPYPEQVRVLSYTLLVTFQESQVSKNTDERVIDMQSSLPHSALLDQIPEIVRKQYEKDQFVSPLSTYAGS